MKHFALCLLIVGVAFSALPARAETASPQVADELIGIVKAQWAAARQKNEAEAMKNVSEECTEFNAVAGTRVEGKALLTRIAEAGDKDSGTTVADEMLNPKVQVYGDTAIVSYNFFGMAQDKEGKVKPNRAKSTRVYVKQSGKWMLVHANFGADPLSE
jgi:ketosteroid isomerase-like protein